MNILGYEATHLLTTQSLQEFLNKENLKNLSNMTDIPYDTLKNYRSGRTPLENIPYRLLKPLSDQAFLIQSPFIGDHDPLLNKEDWDFIVSKHRPNGYNPLIELYLPYFYYHIRTTTPYRKTYRKMYFLLDLEELNKKDEFLKHYINLLKEKEFNIARDVFSMFYIIKDTNQPLNPNVRNLLSLLKVQRLESNKIYSHGYRQISDGNLDGFEHLVIAKQNLFLDKLKETVKPNEVVDNLLEMFTTAALFSDTPFEDGAFPLPLLKWVMPDRQQLNNVFFGNEEEVESALAEILNLLKIKNMEDSHELSTHIIKRIHQNPYVIHKPEDDNFFEYLKDDDETLFFGQPRN